MLELASIRQSGSNRSVRRALRLTAVLGVAGLAALGVQAQSSSLDRIKARGQINVGYRDDAPPFSYLDARRHPQGYSIDVCNAVAAQASSQLALNSLRINMVPVPIDRVTTYLRDGTVDLLCSSTSDTPGRRATMSFSKPVFIDGVGVLVRKKDGITHIGDLADGPVAAIKSTTAPEALRANPASSEWKVEAVLNGDAGLSQLQLGWVKGFARDRVLLAVQRAALPNAEDFAILPELVSTERVAIAMRKDDTAMQELVDKVITDAADSGKATEWYNRWFVRPIVLGKYKTALGIPMSAELKATLGIAK
jgi:glutamate/aspartate transport system substrate-binding protein